MNPFEKLALAMSYVTTIGIIDSSRLANDDSLAGLAKYLPTVGMVIGLFLLCVSRIFAHMQMNLTLSAALIVILWLVLTGGLHMDGLMDTADGIFSHQSQERMLEIMKDSRSGNFAVLAAIAVVVVKILSLSTFTPDSLGAALVLSPSLARACQVFAIGRFSYARQSGKGKIWHDTMTFPGDLFASLWPVAIVALCCLHFAGARFVLILSLGTIIGGVAAAYWLNKKVGGQTGDTYGAVVEISEVTGVLAAAIWATP